MNHNQLNLPLRLLTLLFLFFASHAAQSQNTDSLQVVRVDTAKRYVWIMDYGEISCSDVKPISLQNLDDPAVKYTSLKNNRSYHRKNKCFDQLIFFRCRLKNESDKQQDFRIFSGFYMKNARVFKYFPASGTMTEIISEETGKDEYDLLKISFAPHEECIVTYVAQSAKSNNLMYQPMLITEEYAPIYTSLVRYDKTGGVSFGYIVTGILLLMIFFSMISYLQSFRLEFLYFFGFAFFIGLLFLFKANDYHYLSHFAAVEEEIIDFLLQLAGHISFLLFTIRFLETREKYPAVHKILIAAIILLSASFILFTVGYLSNLSYDFLATTENLTKYAFIGLGVYFVIAGLIYYKDKLFRYLLYGNIAMLLTGVISQLMSQYQLVTKGSFSLLTQALFYYEAGIVMELGFFLLGLVYKNFKEMSEKVREQERLRAENEKKEMEKQFAVFTAQQEERNRISADMHDELGAGMTAIRLMSEIAITKTSDKPISEIQRISETANDIVGKLNAIIWSMSTSNDSLTNTISYIRKYSDDYFENTDIHFTANTPIQIAERELSGEKRRNIFLCVKEALNNILKHANATEVNLSFETNDELRIIIRDNGRGIQESERHLFNNGLKNMRKRMEKIGGSCEISNHNGVTVVFTIPLV